MVNNLGKDVYEQLPLDVQSAIDAVLPYQVIDRMIARKMHIDDAVMDWVNAQIAPTAPAGFTIRCERYLNRVRFIVARKPVRK